MQTAHHAFEYTDGIFAGIWYQYRKSEDQLLKPVLNFHFVGSESLFIKTRDYVLI